MNATRKTAIALAALVALLVPAAAQAAAPAPAWQLQLTAMPTNFAPGTIGGGSANESAGPMYSLFATNVGGAPTSGPITYTVTLSAGVSAFEAEGLALNTPPGPQIPTCSVGGGGQTVTCTTEETMLPGHWIGAQIWVEVDPSLALGEPLEASATIEGGGASAVTAIAAGEVNTDPPPFGLLPGAAGLSTLFSEADGSAAAQAGGHPFQLTLGMGFPTKEPGPTALTAAGHPRTLITDLPRGVLANPSATPVRCTEVELISGEPGEDSCPPGSQVGVISILTLEQGPNLKPVGVFNMVPPPGVPAALGFNAAKFDIFVHILGGVRSDGDYGLTARVNDVLARTTVPIMGVKAELWGDPSAEGHNGTRGLCVNGHLELCPSTAPGSTAFLTMPSHCTAQPLFTALTAASWEEPDVFVRREAPSADLQGNPVGTGGCNQESFEPTIASQPTTNLADSPSGLDFDLHQPQNQQLDQIAPANLKDATVTLPAGMAVNPAQADGLAACSQTQIGYLGQGHYSKAPNSCPDAAKIGTVEASSPLLAQYTEGGKKPVIDPETGEPEPEPLQGSVYVAKPFENQFGSLLAVYLAIESKEHGIVSKLAGKVTPNPVTGQLTTRFTESPELPLEDVRLHLFSGARASLITPPTCGKHTTSSELTPWSTPEGLDSHPSDSFAISASPSGGSCPSSEAQQPNSPTFAAGTLAPQAAAYSPFVLKLARNDGSQRIGGLEATLPPGLLARVAGIARCSEAQIARATSRSNPNEGAVELSDPSCPASSKVGVVDVAAGAGPTPLHTEGTAYLAGPYKGAPLSLAIITPAVAGPFDLGVVVVRSALYVDPVAVRGHAVSDPLPRILAGIPLDVRSVEVRLDKSKFTLNPTSCDPMQITASSLSALGQSAALQSPFQVGGCSSLPFKPKLSLRLKGGAKRADHPKLIATLSAKEGEANIAKAQVKLPPSAFLDQAHIKTICTRVQFAAGACPQGSVYGTATATTPLLDETLSGNVYLRSSSHKLPDLVAALKGPASLPVEVELSGRTDSVKGALRNTFEAVPDAPVSKFRLELFGGKRGLVINSRNLCAHPYRAEVKLDGQNGKAHDTKPLVRSDCKKKKKRGRDGGDHRR